MRLDDRGNLILSPSRADDVRRADSDSPEQTLTERHEEHKIGHEAIPYLRFPSPVRSRPRSTRITP